MAIALGCFVFKNQPNDKKELVMLVLSRKIDQEILINGNIKISVLKIKGNVVRIGIEAPDEVSIKRGELASKDVVQKPVDRSGDSAVAKSIPIGAVNRDGVDGDALSHPRFCGQSSQQTGSDQGMGYQLIPLSQASAKSNSLDIQRSQATAVVENQFAETLQRHRMPGSNYGELIYKSENRV